MFVNIAHIYHYNDIKLPFIIAKYAPSLYITEVFGITLQQPCYKTVIHFLYSSIYNGGHGLNFLL